jgi:hydrogenase expression/formation protein HypD
MTKMFEVANESRSAVERLVQSAARLARPAAYMEVCGTHTVNAFRSGLHSLMPWNVKLLSGPGCPVCVTAQGEIDQMIELASGAGVTLCTYGDMLHVPGTRGSLEEARGCGAGVRVIYSALDAVKLAEREPGRQAVLAAVGFETTAPTTAAAVLAADRARLGNFTVLASHKRIIPAMRGLLEAGQVNVDGFLCPGHVAVVIGSDAFGPIVRDFALPCVIAGFEDQQIASGLAQLVEQTAAGEAAVENHYPQAVSAAGNVRAREVMEEVFEPVDAYWRGLGELRGSGLAVRGRYGRFDAQVRYELPVQHREEMRGCRCGEVITGRAEPGECGLFGTACTPARPVGPCMVSPEGSCQAWFKYRRGAGGGRVAEGGGAET